MLRNSYRSTSIRCDTYLLDTNVCIEFLRPGAKRRAGARLLRITQNQVTINSIVVHELVYGALKSARPEFNLTKVEAFCRNFDVIEVIDRVAVVAAEMRVALESQGTPMGTWDLLIAATAAHHNLAVVTNNVREFARIPNIRIEDWSQPGD